MSVCFRDEAQCTKYVENKCCASFRLPCYQFHKATMLMLAGIVVLHITTIILLLVATIDNVSHCSVPLVQFHF